MRILVTGGAGCIGSAFVRHLIGQGTHEVLNFDKLTDAGDPPAVASAADDPHYRFVQSDICDVEAMCATLSDFRPDVLTRLAVESHVDRSIDSPGSFIQTNLVGTFVLLSETCAYWEGLAGEERALPLPLHFGGRGLRLARGRGAVRRGNALRSPLALFGVQGRLRPSGERLGAHLRPVPLSGEADPAGHRAGARGQAATSLRPRRPGSQLALRRRPYPRAAARARDRDTRSHLQYWRLQRTAEHRGGANHPHAARPAPAAARWGNYAGQIAFVADRPGYDKRYAIDTSRIRDALGRTLQETFESGIAKTVSWYLANEAWWRTLIREHQADTWRGLAH